MAKKPIEEIENDAKPLDLIVLELPASVQMCVSRDGTDRVSGFYVGVNEVRGQKVVSLSRTQKGAYANDEPIDYPFRDISSYEVKERFVPDPHDGIDEVLCEVLGIDMPEQDEDSVPETN
jgi:hypothetical protein